VILIGEINFGGLVFIDSGFKNMPFSEPDKYLLPPGWAKRLKKLLRIGAN